MKKFKKAICLALALMLFASLSVSAFAASGNYEGEKRVVLGADVTEEQASQVYSMFGITRGDVTELTVTNADERVYLEGLIADSTIGTRAISCIYIEVLGEDDGLDIDIQNINWCTEEIYENALLTAGIYDADVKIAAPFAVSGTAALTGIYKAYEDITGATLSEEAKQTAVEELVVTSELAEDIGGADAAEVVNELKKILAQTSSMSDEQLEEEIRTIAENLNVELTDSQVSQLISLVRSLEKLDVSALTEKLQSLQDTVKKVSGLGDKISGFFSSVVDFFGSIGNFFANLF